MPVELAGNASQEGCGNEDGKKHQGRGHHGPGHFFHGLDGRLFGLHVKLVHVAGRILHYHDGVIHHDTDGKDKPEQGQHVQGKAQYSHHHKGSNEGYGDGDTGNKRGPPVLKEEKDGNKDQQDGDKQGLNHFLDGCPDEQGGVKRNFVFKALGEGALQLLHLGLDFLGQGDGVGPGKLIDTENRVWFAVEQAVYAVGLRSQLDGGHIL